MTKWLFRFFVVIMAGLIAIPRSLPLQTVEGMPLGATVTPDVFYDQFNEDEACSLREALYSVRANSDYGGCTHTGSWNTNPSNPDYDIVLLSHGTYELTLYTIEDDGRYGDLDLWQGVGALASIPFSPSIAGYDITIQGDDAGSTIDGNGIDRVFEIQSGISVLMDNLIITGGNSKSSEVDPNGGGILIEGGILKITDSIIINNSTQEGDPGGGIANHSDLTLDDVVIQDNRTGNSYSADPSGPGGGIFNAADIHAVDVYITGNHTGGNSSTGRTGEGAGIWNTGTGDISLSRVTISENNCGGASANYGSDGGGLFNSAGGVIEITTSTISSNHAGSGGGGDHHGGHGGGIFNRGILTIDDSTIAYNYSGYNSGTGASHGGGLSNEDGTATLKNTILANNLSFNTTNYDHDCDGGFISAGYNLVEDDLGCTITGLTDTMTDMDPLLGPLADHGGYGWMHSLLPGSPAIDAGPLICFTPDQRHVLRPIDADFDGIKECDIGAFEFNFVFYLPSLLKP